MSRILQGPKPKDRAARKSLKLQLFRNRFRRAGEAIIREETLKRIRGLRDLQFFRHAARKAGSEQLETGLRQISKSVEPPEVIETRNFGLVRLLANEVDPRGFRQKVRREKRMFSREKREAEERRQSYVLKESKPLGTLPTLKKGALSLDPLDVQHHMQARSQKAKQKLKERRLRQRKR